MKKTCSHESGNQKIQVPDKNPAKKSSKKWIFGFLILVVLIAASGIFSYYKWFVPYRVESYVTKAVNDYNQLQGDLNEVSTAFKDLEILETNSINQTTGRIDNAIEMTERALANENNRRVPGQVKELHNKLIIYYDDIDETLQGIENFTVYFKKLAPVANDLSEDTVSTQEGSSSQIESVLANSRGVHKKLEADLKKLNQISAPSGLGKLHGNLVNFLESRAQFISDLIESLEAENYDQIETLTGQAENEQSEYSKKFEGDIDSFEKNSQISSWSEDLTKQEEEVENLVAELKSKYNF